VVDGKVVATVYPPSDTLYDLSLLGFPSTDDDGDGEVEREGKRRRK
jgi:hypothetical protein